MPLRGKKILITCGPTWVALDDVRVLSNRSTGEMGHLLAKALKSSLAQVTLLEGPVTHFTKIRGIKLYKYSFFDELKSLMYKELLRGYDCIIHAAAVSDFRPERKITGKIRSDSKVSLLLSPLPKLINSIKTLNPKVFLIGFKLEDLTASEAVIQGTKKLFRQSKCDLVVANFIKPNGYEALVIDKNRSLLGKVKNKKDLVSLLVQTLKKDL